jgi:dipeptidyl aminopeptidase/acylaminoacyl peptidase
MSLAIDPEGIGAHGPSPVAAAESPAPTPAPVIPGRSEKGNLVIEGIPEIPQEIADKLLQYQNARSATLESWTPQGGLLIRTRFGETAQLHRVDAPTGMRRQLTFFNEPIAGGSYPRTTSAKGFGFVRDTGGDEQFQIYFRDDAAGADMRITEPNTRNESAAWSRDGSMFAWSQATKDSGVYKIFVAATATPDQKKLVFEREGSWQPIDWSNDNSKLLIGHYVSVTEGEIFVLDVASSALTEVNPSETKIAYDTVLFSPDSSAVYASSNEGREFLTLIRYPVSGGEKSIISGDITWDVEDFDISPDGNYLAFSVNEGGLSKIHVLSLPGHTPVAGPDLPPGIVGGLLFSPDSKQLGFSFTNAQSSGDVWTFELASQKLTRWTESEVGGLDPSKFVLPDLVSYPTFDQVDGQARQIPLFVYKPKKSGPHPVVIFIHGGPESQERPDFTATFQFWLNELGIAILAPNVRGSSGYGTSYLELDNAMKREDSVKDIGALLDWIATQPDLDSKRVMVYGGSYGGYMVNASLTHYSDRLAGGVSAVGISNFVTFLENTSGYRRDLRRVEYGDERDPEMRKFLESISPLNNAAKITKPLFIIQGANDPRVPLSESEQLLARVKEGGGGPWYLMAKDEGHGFQKKANRDYQSAAIVMFLKQRLLGEPAGQ